MPTYTELMEILKANEINEIRGYSHYTKSKLTDFLIKREQIPEKYDTNNHVRARKDIDPKYYFPKQIRSNPKKVEINDFETDNIVLYPSVYKAALALDQNPGVIDMYNGKIWRIRYAIKELTESEYFKNLNMFVLNMNILRFFSKLQTFCYRLIGMTTSCLI